MNKLGVVVMTGGTSGFGLSAASRFVNASDKVILAMNKSQGPEGSVCLPVDLRQLPDVRAFAAGVIDMAGDTPIDALILNAGGGFPFGRSADGFELNFAVNHLAHYLLLRLLTQHLAEGAVVVVTTSGTHDPAEKTMIPPPIHADAYRLAYPDRDRERDRSENKAAGRAYAASKLCNLLTARAFAASNDAVRKGIRVVAYSPGPTPGTGLVRGRGAILNFVWRHVLPALRWAMPRLNSAEDAGRALAQLALGEAAPPAGRIYALFERGALTYPDPSELAQRDDVMWKLWEDSAALVGLSSKKAGD